MSDQPRRPAMPDLSTDSGRIAFNKLLNNRLPTKRNIAQGLLRNERGEILLCELTYKKDWDLPGGVVECLSEDLVSRPSVAYVRDECVAAAGDQGDERRLERRRLQKGRSDVAVQVVHGRQR